MSKTHAAILIIPATLALAGSFVHETPVAEASPERAEASPAFRVQVDLARGRRWELGWDGAAAYDIASGELIRRVSLPGATFAGDRDSCLPDMILSRSGALIVSSNIEPRLWRVSPARFEVEVYDVATDGDEDKDFGFANLAWGASEKMLYAAGSPTGTPWRIDLVSGTAARVEPSSALARASCGRKAGEITSPTS